VEEAFFNSAPENSKELINKNYYIKLEKITDFNELQDEEYNNINSNNPNFKFSLEENGLYYKFENTYIQDFSGIKSGKHYNIFVKIEKLLKDKESLVFEEVPNMVNWNYGEIRNNYLEYYYKENNKYTLNTES